MSRLTGEGDHVVLANRNHLDGECVFVVVGVGVDVVTDELLAVLILDRDHGLEELYQRLPLALRGEEEVETLVVRLDANTVLGRVVFYQQLLQEKQGLPLLCFLSHLKTDRELKERYEGESSQL